MASSLLWSLQLRQAQFTEQSPTSQYRIAADLSRSRIYFIQDNEVRDFSQSCCSSLQKDFFWMAVADYHKKEPSYRNFKMNSFQFFRIDLLFLAKLYRTSVFLFLR